MSLRRYFFKGRQEESKEKASERAMQALADNPDIRNLYVAILEVEYTDCDTVKEQLEKEEEVIGKLPIKTRTMYQARWYDFQVTHKNREAKRQAERLY